MADLSSQDTAKQKIYRAVRRSIIMGHREPGDRLNVEELAERCGTSVTPVRDALQMLSQEGLVTIKPRSGYFVARMTLKQLHDLLDLREILELSAVERAAERISDEQLAQLESVHAGYTGDDDASYDRYTDENRRFHYLIAQASGNQELADALGRLHDRLAYFMVIRRAGQTMETSHGEIIAALRARDAEAARRVMRAEIDDTRQLVLNRVIQQEGDAWRVGGQE